MGSTASLNFLAHHSAPILRPFSQPPSAHSRCPRSSLNIMTGNATAIHKACDRRRGGGPHRLKWAGTMGHVVDRPARWRGGSDADRPTGRPAGHRCAGPSFCRPSDRSLRTDRHLAQDFGQCSSSDSSSGLEKWDAALVVVLTGGTLLPWWFSQVGCCPTRDANRWDAAPAKVFTGGTLPH